MNFKDSTSVLATINAGDEIEIVRSQNRAIVDNLFNGGKPLTDAEAVQSNQRINVNWGEGPVLRAQACRQYTNAFQRPSRKFRVTIPTAPLEKQMEWEMKITDFLNRVLKNSQDYFHLIKNKFNSVVSHGIGPQVWEDKENWLARYLAVSDLRVPTDTEVGFRNLEWFAARYYYTEGELAAKVFSDDSSTNWNKEAVSKILAPISKANNSTNYTWLNQPEKLAELMKQNGGYWSSDAVPSIPLWHFFFKDRDKKGKVAWKFRVLADTKSGTTGASDEFLYDAGDKSYADDLSEILHVQYGDLGSTAPALYHSVRSLGFLLVEPCFYTNLARCRTLQFLFESFNTWFRVSDPAGKSRALEIQLFDKAVIPEGVSIVNQQERHHVDPGMIDMVMSQLKQLQAEASSSYTQQSDSGTQKEQTAYETSVKVAQVNAMMSGMLLVAFTYAKFEYIEICRRFCIRGSENEDVKDFHAMAKQAGIPPYFMNHKLWEIDPEVPLGAGNPTMEAAQASQLMQFRPMLSPSAQQEVLHTAIAATTQNPEMANRLVPLEENAVATTGARWAASVFGTLMSGAAVPVNENVPATEVIETLLGMLGAAIQGVEQTDNMGTPDKLVGFQTVMQYVGQLVQQISGDQAQGEKVKAYGEALMKMGNTMKGFATRQQQAEEAKNIDPEIQAKAQATMMQAQQKMQVSQATTQQKMAHKDAAFKADQQRKSMATMSDQQRKNITTQSGEQRSNIETAAQVHRDGVQTAAQIELEKLKAQAVADTKQSTEVP